MRWQRQPRQDNDPTGFKSRLGERGKKASKIRVFQIPKRSPDLNVMDYAIWRPINRKMRLQERRFHVSKRETRAEYISRLRRVALNLPRKTIEKAVAQMKTRCELLYKVKCGHFEEGAKLKTT